MVRRNDAYTRGDIGWIKKSIKKNLFIWKTFAVITIIMIFASHYVYKFWIGNAVNIPFKLTFFMGLYVIANTFMVPFVFFINGIGKIKLQFLISIATGILNVPISIFFAKVMHIGSAGVILGTVVTITPFLILMPLQYRKILYGNAKGIWNK